MLDAIYRLAYPAVSATEASSPEEQDVCRDAISRFLANDAEYPLALAYAALGARRLVTDHASALLASRARERIVFAGFDSGDAICIGALRPDGLRFSSASEQMRWHSSTSRFSVG